MDFIFSDQPKELIFNDRENQRQVIFRYREPTAEERIRYHARILALFRNRTKNDPIPSEEISRIQFEYGAEILTGFRASGIPINISPDPDAPDYHPEWKKLVSNRATDLVVALGRNVFESGGYAPEKN
jgi:hypothetical protein